MRRATRMRTRFDPDGTHAHEALALRRALERYAPLEDATWDSLRRLLRRSTHGAGEQVWRVGDVPTHFGFVLSGLLRYAITDAEGDEYNKVFFPEGTFPGPIVALLTGQPSRFTIQALEPTTLLEIEFAGFRRLLDRSPDLMRMQIAYLERHWLVEKEAREVSLVQEDAGERYRRFRRERPELFARLPLYQVASHLGITPTQLSRIRRAERAEEGEGDLDG